MEVPKRKVCTGLALCSCHTAFSEDALNAKRMNMKPGRKQPAMRETQWGSRPQKDGRPKGMKIILEERGIHTETLNVDNMRTILSNHDDFREGKSLVEHFLANRGHTVMFIPKLHCELNPIERVWGQAKVYTRTYTNFTIQRLRRIINPALDSVSPDLIRKFFQKAMEYERAYIEGKEAGRELEQAVKVYKSQCRIF